VHTTHALITGAVRDGLTISALVVASIHVDLPCPGDGGRAKIGAPAAARHANHAVAWAFCARKRTSRHVSPFMFR
jgi:hypothetical protein